MAYWQSKEVQAAAKGVLKEKLFVEQTIGSPDDLVFEKGTAEQQSMVLPLCAGPRDKDVGPWDLLIWLSSFDLAL